MPRTLRNSYPDIARPTAEGSEWVETTDDKDLVTFDAEARGRFDLRLNRIREANQDPLGLHAKLTRKQKYSDPAPVRYDYGREWPHEADMTSGDC